MPGSDGKKNANAFSRWPAFQDALACALKMTIAVVEPCGEVISWHSPLYPFSYLEKHPVFLAAYNEFFRRVPRLYEEIEDRICLDPMGLSVNMEQLEDGSYLLLGGCLGRHEPRLISGLSERLDGLEVHERGRFWSRMMIVTPEEMEDYSTRVVELYNKMFRYFKNPGLPELLAAVEKVNKLIVATFAPEHFDLGRILELLTSALVFFAGGGGAFAFTYEYPGRVETVYCGEHVQISRALAEDWRKLGQVKDPAAAFSELIRDKVKNEFNAALEGTYRKRNGTSVFLGVIGAAGGHLEKILTILVKKAAIALGVSLLSTVFQFRWGMVFNSIRQGIVVADRQGKILMMNQAAKTFFTGRGITPELEHPVSDYDLGRQISEAVCSASKSGVGFTQKRTTIGEGKLLTHLRWEVVPLPHHDGRNAGAVLVFDDITEPIKLHHEIQDWERLATAGEIAAGLAHEIRNPLATAKAAIQLARIVDDPVRRDELLKKLDFELDRMNRILTNFLDISKPTQEERLEPVDLARVLHELLFLLRGEALFNEIDLEADIPVDEPFLVMGSPNSIKQVFLNIARNAIEAMGEGGRLVISLFSTNGRIYVRFRDNGPGIPPEKMATLTKPFFTTKPGGTGLGLSISLSAVKMMGGELQISSRQGEGTTVETVFPVSD